MTDPRPSLFNRPDTFFGVCEGLGEDLHIHANLLRVAFGAGFFFAPLLAVALYLMLGAVVAASRYAFPVTAAAAPDLDQGVEQAVSDDAELALAA